MSGHVTTTVDSYSWVRPAFPAPAPEADWTIASVEQLAEEISAFEGGKFSFDTETTGLRYWVPGFEMKSIAIYHPNTNKLLAASLLDASDEGKSKLLKALTPNKLYAFNGQFDMGVLVATNRALPKKLRVDEEELLHAFAACSQVLFRHCTNEGFNVHSLEMAQRNLFGWEDSQKDWLASALADAGLDKGSMWKLLETEHREGFLYYNAMDARSAWLVWDHLCKEARRIDREGMIQFHEQEFATLIRDCVRQAFTGMPLDKKGMRKILIDAFKERARIYGELRNHPDITPFVEHWEANRIAEVWKLETEKKYRKLSDAKIVSDALEDYGVDREEEGEEEEADKGVKTVDGPAEMQSDTLCSPHFEIKMKTKKGWGKKFPGFNFGSPDHLQELLYGHLAKAELAYMKKQGDDELPRYRITFRGKEYLVGCTDSGAIPTGAEIHPIFEEIGELLMKAAEADTRFGFAKSYLAAASETGRIHTQLKPHGAATGRCSGGSGDKKKSKKALSVSPHQLPRTDKEFMECFTAPKGLYYLSNDFRGLEKVVQAELSGDPVLGELYASGLPHDVHLFHTARIHPNVAIRSRIMEEYRPDKEVVKRLKKEFKEARGQGKAYGFSLDYNSGAESIMLKSFTQGSPITLEAAEEIRNNYRNIYKVYYAWAEGKKHEWRHLGWIEDGFGFPIGIDARRLDRQGYPSALREAGSKIVQRTGHYILLNWLKHIEAIKRERKLWKLERPVICDLHDERIVLTPDPEACNALHLEALARVNEELSPKIRFEIASEWGATLYDCKKG